MFKVRHGVAPDSISRRYKSAMYPFTEMKKAQWFEVPADHPAAQKNESGSCSVQSSAHSAGRRLGYKFQTYRTPSNSVVVKRIA
jgi:hypothetical protein